MHRVLFNNIEDDKSILIDFIRSVNTALIDDLDFEVKISDIALNLQDG